MDTATNWVTYWDDTKYNSNYNYGIWIEPKYQPFLQNNHENIEQYLIQRQAYFGWNGTRDIVRVQDELEPIYDFIKKEAMKIDNITRVLSLYQNDILYLHFIYEKEDFVIEQEISKIMGNLCSKFEDFLFDAMGYSENEILIDFGNVIHEKNMKKTKRIDIH